MRLTWIVLGWWIWKIDSERQFEIEQDQANRTEQIKNAMRMESSDAHSENLYESERIINYCFQFVALHSTYRSHAPFNTENSIHGRSEEISISSRRHGILYLRHAISPNQMMPRQ